MYFVIRNKQYINVAGESFRAFLEGKLPQLPGEKPTIKDWEDHLSTLFPEVRLKQFLEMRGADMGDEATTSRRCRRSGSGCSTTTRRSTAPGSWSRTGPTRSAQALRDDVPRTALAHRRSAAARCADIAARGRRPRPGRPRAAAAQLEDGKDETIYLAPLEETLDLGKTPAERWLDKYHGEWAGDLTRIFDEAEM